ncbi:hypothetical protein CDG76_34560 [Nostoc sp. 'Peltigera membranacea cyanobiont' 210A]|uniref:2OG-Fe(II) oxygenase family protein n=1 Tax=Nostoc sp. 'Peltigera membranacea cyanobiont' 210A TaxID=2014529 RepID=UPI000B956BDB|nr:2OG-Fe(II) oxygenase family protein [Nostoc sp. 'Peltigera membranacea cyanobiont' 210A]OYD89704.1 hypothetical protein CDG76_34560 [Nostoc sp. 'Peltigera membranacea cyanobiont' 210A]
MRDVTKALVVPTVDIESFCTHGSRSDPVDSLTLSVLNAARTAGVMSVIGHGVSNECIDAMFASATRFFAQPDVVKLSWSKRSAFSTGFVPFVKKKDSLKEEYDFGTPRESSRSDLQKHYPIGPAIFSGVIDEYYREMERVEAVLLALFSRALGKLLGMHLPDDYLKQSQGGFRGLLRVNYYPSTVSCDEMDYFRNGAHEDWSSITLLAVDGEGLEILDSGHWHAVPYIPNAIVVLVGNQLAMRSNGGFTACVHRVSGKVNCVNARLSLVYFGCEWFDPDDRAVIAPLCPEGVEPKYQPTSIKDHLLRLAGLQEGKLSYGGELNVEDGNT